MTDEDLDDKINALVREADDLFGRYDADTYKKELNELIRQVEKCDFGRAMGSISKISDEIDRELKDFRTLKLEAGEELGQGDMQKIQRGHRLENETMHALKFLFSENCGCRLK